MEKKGFNTTWASYFREYDFLISTPVNINVNVKQKHVSYSEKLNL